MHYFGISNHMENKSDCCLFLVVFNITVLIKTNEHSNGDGTNPAA